MRSNISKLLILYELASFSFPEREENFMPEIIERATRLLGVKRFVFAAEEDKCHRLFMWGFQDEQEAWEQVNKKKDNSFLYNFRQERPGFLYFEQSHALSEEDKRLYTILGRRIQDFFQRQWAEEALEISRRNLQKVFNNINDAIFIQNMEGTIIDVNNKMLEMFGVPTKEEALQLSIYEDLSSPDNIFELVPGLWKKAISGENQIFEWRARRLDNGSPFDVEFYLCKLGFGSESVVLSTARDITFRKQEEQLLKNIFLHSPIGMFISKKGKFQLVNSQVVKYSGYSEEELLGMDSSSLIFPGDREMVRGNVIIMLKRKSLRPYEFRFVDKKGKIRWVASTVTNIRYRDEMVILGNVIDITERKETDEKLRYLSFHDSLTGLYNRAYFEEELRRLNSKRQLPLSIIMGDVNELKLINDIFGHQLGDSLLVKIANKMKDSCRKEDIICRWGGDEFVILLPKTGKKTAEEVCTRIKNACNNTMESLPLSISLGSATRENIAQDTGELIKEAEEKMYRQKYLESKKEHLTFIDFLQKTLTKKTDENEEHLLGLEKYSINMGKTLKLPYSELEKLAQLSFLHDIGMMAMPDSILQKSGSLTSEEYEILKKHCEIGYRIAQSIPLLHISEEILSHHERWDGTGYPRGLKGEEIPLLSRILAIADAYEVMITGRRYQEKINKAAAIQELRKYAGTQFDPALVDLFIKLIN